MSESENKPLSEQEQALAKAQAKFRAVMIDRYQRAAHAMQSGVAFEYGRVSPENPKHYRVGINCAMTDHASLARLLIRKGIITEEEYLEEIAIGMEEEAKRYEKLLREKYGIEVKLA